MTNDLRHLKLSKKWSEASKNSRTKEPIKDEPRLSELLDSVPITEELKCVQVMKVDRITTRDGVDISSILYAQSSNDGRSRSPRPTLELLQHPQADRRQTEKKPRR